VRRRACASRAKTAVLRRSKLREKASVLTRSCSGGHDDPRADCHGADNHAERNDGGRRHDGANGADGDDSATPQERWCAG